MSILDPKIIKMLNDYANSQPALRLPGEPLGKSNPNLGDALEAALATTNAIALNAQGQLFTPGAGGNWVDADPTTIKAAVDRLAAAVAGLLAAPIP